MSVYGKLLILIAISTSSGFKYDSNYLNEIEKKEGYVNIKDILHNVVSQAANKNVEEKPNGCVCVNYNCGCCARIAIKDFDLNDTLCANMSYLPEDYGISLTVTFGKRTLLNETVSARNPPPICADIPHLKNLVSVCIRFRDLAISNHTFSGCMDLEVRLAEVIKEEYKLGCFKLPKKDGLTPIKDQGEVQAYKTEKREWEPYIRLLHSAAGVQGAKYKKNGSG